MDFLDVIVPILPTCLLLILVLLMGIGINYLWLRLMYKRIRACPACSEKGTAEIVDIDEIIISNKVDYQRRKPVRIKETKYTDHYKCKNCDHIWTRTYIEKERIPMEDVNTT
jgi:hypothetical protein